MTELIFYLLVTCGTSFLCSLMESVILSVSPEFISMHSKTSRRSGQLLKSLHAHVDRPLAAILTLNTIANTIGPMLIAREVVHLYGSGALAVASGSLTFIILIFSEIVPKTLGANNAKSLAPVAAYIVTGMVYLTLPAVVTARLINRILVKSRRRRSTRAEMIAAAELSADDGVIHQKEGKIIKNLLMLDSIKVSEIMTPRSVVNAFDMTETVGAVMDRYKPVRFSRIPLYDKELDNVQGLLHRYKLMEAVSHDMYNMPLKDIMTSIHRVTENTSVSAALDQFIKRREHLFLVCDAHDRMTGIVTLEDAVETLLGVEIVDEYDAVTDMRQYAIEQLRLKKQTQAFALQNQKKK